MTEAVITKDTRMTSIYTPWKQKTFGFLMFSGGIDWRRSNTCIINFECIQGIYSFYCYFKNAFAQETDRVLAGLMNHSFRKFEVSRRSWW